MGKGATGYSNRTRKKAPKGAVSEPFVHTRLGAAELDGTPAEDEPNVSLIGLWQASSNQVVSRLVEKLSALHLVFALATSSSSV